MSSDKLKILTTGGSGGLGNTVLQLLLENGYSVHDLSKRANSYSTYIQNNKGFSFQKVDFEKFDDKSKLDLNFNDYSHAVFMHGVAFNKSLFEIDMADVLSSLKANFVGTFFLAQKILFEWVKRENKGIDKSLTFISSVATKGASPAEIPYHCSKRAMESAMLAFAREFSNVNIRSNVISPGLMANKLGYATVQNRPDVLSRIPLGRPVDTQDIASVILMAMNNKSLTGQNLHVNCGRYFDI